MEGNRSLVEGIEVSIYTWLTDLTCSLFSIMLLEELVDKLMRQSCLWNKLVEQTAYHGTRLCKALECSRGIIKLDITSGVDFRAMLGILLYCS